METLGVYVQVPFCSSKCSFCNFSSEVMPVRAIESYERTLEQEEVNREVHRLGEELQSRLGVIFG